MSDWRFREQARSHIWNAFPCGSEPAREAFDVQAPKASFRKPGAM